MQYKSTNPVYKMEIQYRFESSDEVNTISHNKASISMDDCIERILQSIFNGVPPSCYLEAIDFHGKSITASTTMPIVFKRTYKQRFKTKPKKVDAPVKKPRVVRRKRRWKSPKRWRSRSPLNRSLW